MSHQLITVFFFASLSIYFIHAYTIPLPFGGVDVNKRPDGSDEVSIHHGINVSGYGTSSGLTFTGGNGTGGTVSSHGGILDGKGGQYGIGNTFGGDKKKGVQLDSDLNLGNETVHGGVGKESQFFTELDQLSKKKKQEEKEKIHQ
uniref:Uncharacterized protein n=1 Tax=Panagrolaimus sp. PS1159 TaxID=55785 RepID=A0AC35FYX3_9BILA